MPYINQISTYQPAYKYSQIQIANFLQTIHPQISESIIERILKNSAIEYRYSVLPDFELLGSKKALYKKTSFSPTVSERMHVYHKMAFQLANHALSQLKFNPTTITHIITVSCTGILAPGIDIQLMHAFGISTQVERHNINFMGCFAAFHALKQAKTICKAEPNAEVLIVCVELCTLHMQEGNELEQLVSNALFADGCAVSLVSNEETGLQLEDHFQYLVPETTHEMSWNLSEKAFAMRLSSKVPALIQSYLTNLKSFIEEKQITIHALHPGGRKIMEAYAEALNLNKDRLNHSYSILKNYGNMSSPTILYVLNEILKSTQIGTILAMGFGPGLTVEGLLLHKK